MGVPIHFGKPHCTLKYNLAHTDPLNRSRTHGLFYFAGQQSLIGEKGCSKVQNDVFILKYWVLIL